MNRKIRFALAALLAATFAEAGMDALAAGVDETVLVRRGEVVITRADWDAEMLRIPPKDRADFAANPRRVRQLLDRMLVTRELAARAKAQKLDADPATAVRLKHEQDRILAAALIAGTEEAAGRDFDAKKDAAERRAREQYEVDRAAFASPETVMITVAFFSPEKDGTDGAGRRAADALAKAKAGADLGDLAATLSDDTAARGARGRKGPLARTDLDPALAGPVFALKAKGDLTEAIRTRDGYFVVRLDERRAPVQKSFDEVKADLIARLRQQYVDSARDALVQSVATGRDVVVDEPAVDALRTPAK